MPRKPHRTTHEAVPPSTECGGLFCMNVNCPNCCRFVIDMNSPEFWSHFDASQAPSKVTVDLDDDTYAVLLQEAAEGLRKIPRR
jgi:hypothetical protein